MPQPWPFRSPFLALEGDAGTLFRAPVAPGARLFVNHPLPEQLFPDLRRAPLATVFTSNYGYNKMGLLEDRPPATPATHSDELRRAPPVGPAKVLQLLDVVVLRDTLDDHHDVTSFGCARS